MPETWEGWDAPALARRLDLPGFEIHGAVASTSDRVRELAGRGAPAWTAVLADAQTAGRGRRARAWVSPPAVGVWVSLVLPGAELEVDALLPLRVTLGLSRRLEGAGCRPPGVKWPNDLLLPDGRKVAGVLVERTVLPGGATVAILGVGVNVLGVDPAAARVGGPLKEIWPAAARPAVLEAVVEAARDARAAREGTLGPEEMAGWARRDSLRGREVMVEDGDAPPHQGVVRGIDLRGRLLLETSAGLRHLSSGTVRTGSSGRS